ncbi:MAG: Gfo/Idh/MocA family oxidoreductase [Kiritimatiellae bacterium]|nr:Gfo/Idh/MocA family oxidoreductase [Kiritimatiellia bacterium]
MGGRRNGARELRIGVVGCGHWGKNHVRIFSNMPNVMLAAAAERMASERRTALANLLGVRQYSDVSTMLQREHLDAVVVATPAWTHFDVSAACLSAGLDVLVEKPMCTTVAQCDKLMALARKSRRVLMVGHTFMYNPAVQKVKELIRKGVCGKIYYIKARRTHLGLVREDVNAVWDLAPHDVCMFNYFLNAKPKAVQAVGGRFLSKTREDAAFINLQYPKGVIGNIIVSWADSNKERIVEIVGSKARILFDDLNSLEPVRIFQKGIAAHIQADGFGEFKYALRDGDIVSPHIKMAEPLRVMCEHFIACVRRRSRPMSDGAQGREVVRVLEMVGHKM